MINFLMICTSLLGLFTINNINSNVEQIDNRNRVNAVGSDDYNQGYQDGYNAANNTSVFSPNDLQLVFTLPVNNGNSSDIVYWPVDRDIFSNWFSGGSYDFISTSFFNEWLIFYDDTQYPLIDLDEFYTFTMILDFNSPVSIFDLSFEGFGFSAWAYTYSTSSSTTSLIWNYANGSSDREYYFKSPTLNRNEDTPVAVLLVKSIYLQFTMKLSTGTSSVSSNILKLTDISINDYEQGFILGQESGFNSGFEAGQQDGLQQGFDNGYSQAENYYSNKYDILKNDYETLLERYNSLSADQWNLKHLFWSIGSIPFETFKQIWNFDFLGFNIASFITRISY